MTGVAICELHLRPAAVQTPFLFPSSQPTPRLSAPGLELRHIILLFYIMLIYEKVVWLVRYSPSCFLQEPLGLLGSMVHEL